VSLSKFKRICHFLNFKILEKKKEIKLFENNSKIESLLKALCFEGLLQTYTKKRNMYVIWPRYNSRVQPLCYNWIIKPQYKQNFKIKPTKYNKYKKKMSEVTVLSNKTKFFICGSNQIKGSHILTIK
jgi:hypothetical protein